MKKAVKGVLLAVAICVAGASAAEAQSLGFAAFSAVITKGGATSRGSGVQSSTRTATGVYVVEFTREVADCTVVAGPVGKNGGQASTSPVGTKPTKLRVYTFGRNGAPANLAFALFVSCAS